MDAVSFSLSLQDRPKLPHLGPCTKVPPGSAEAASITEGSGQLRHLGQARPGHGTWDPSFASDMLFLDRPPKAKVGPRPPFMHYCDACSVSCRGPQTYQDHLEGQMH